MYSVRFWQKAEQWGRHFPTNEGFKNHLVGPAISYGRERCFGGGGVRLIRLVRNFVVGWSGKHWLTCQLGICQREDSLEEAWSLTLNQSPINQQKSAWTIWAIKKTSKTIQHTGCFKDLYQAIRMNSIMTSTKNSQPFSESTLLFWYFSYTPENERFLLCKGKSHLNFHLLILVFQPFIFRGVSNTTAPKKASGLPVCPRSSTGSSSFSKS